MNAEPYFPAQRRTYGSKHRLGKALASTDVFGPFQQLALGQLAATHRTDAFMRHSRFELPVGPCAHAPVGLVGLASHLARAFLLS